MALDFGVEKSIYKEALEDIKNIDLPQVYWSELTTLFEEESKKASQSVETQRVDDALLHRCFSL